MADRTARSRALRNSAAAILASTTTRACGDCFLSNDCAGCGKGVVV